MSAAATLAYHYSNLVNHDRAFRNELYLILKLSNANHPDLPKPRDTKRNLPH